MAQDAEGNRMAEYPGGTMAANGNVHANGNGAEAGVQLESPPVELDVNSETEVVALSFGAVRSGFEEAPDPSAGTFLGSSHVSAFDTSISAEAAQPVAEVSGADVVSDETGSKGILGVAPTPKEGDEVAVQAVAQEAKKKFYLVRVPKQDLSELAAKRSEAIQKCRTMDERIRSLSTAITAKMQEREDAFSRVKAGRDLYHSCRAQCDDKYAHHIQPLRESLNGMREAGRGAKGAKQAIRSEGELDERMGAIEYRLSHETVPIAEERQLVRQIELLRATRPQVKEYERAQVAVEEQRGHKDGIAGQLKPHVEEMEVLKAAKESAHKELKQHEAELAVHRAEADALYGKKKEAQALKGQLNALIDSIRGEEGKMDAEYRAGRADMAAAYQLWCSKDVAALEAFCTEQMERIHLQLNTLPAYRQAYFQAGAGHILRKFGTPDTRRRSEQEEEEEAVTQRRRGGRKESAAAEGEKKATAPKPAVEAKVKPAVEAKVKPAVEAKVKPAVEAKVVVPSEKKEVAASTAEELALAAQQQAAVARQAKAEKEREREAQGRKREEEVVKAREAGERKKRLADKAVARASVKAAREAEEAAKKRDKERERKARKKALAAGSAPTGPSLPPLADLSLDPSDSMDPLDLLDALDPLDPVAEEEGPTRKQRKRTGRGKGGRVKERQGLAGMGFESWAAIGGVAALVAILVGVRVGLGLGHGLGGRGEMTRGGCLVAGHAKRLSAILRWGSMIRRSL